MSTDNKSPSYLRDREAARRWLTRTPDGRAARDHLMKHGPGGQARILDDDQHVEWEDLVNENRDLPLLAANCAEARSAFEMARQARSTLGPPGLDKARWIRFFATPVAYVLRRQIETGDPDYWNDPRNLYREALDHPEWLCVPAEVIRGELEKVLPRKKQPNASPFLDAA